MFNRRRFLYAATTGLAASIVLRGKLQAQLERVPALPGRSLLEKDDDRYWAEMRQQFLIPEDEVYL
ncbi:MAG TPA: aminotransferase class V-fold PLP-dependent enzyme, partial [Candidatus Binatia bacterium]|nr:aminotransferase class V-fold PLP-dependent enzyme [Candidatus Binatia bacterium]